jgi:hypothetical protein
MNILINQLGYTPEMQKEAVLRGKLGEKITVRDAAGNAVLTLPVAADRMDIWGLYTAVPGSQASQITKRSNDGIFRIADEMTVPTT